MPINNTPTTYDPTALEKLRDSQATMANDNLERAETNQYIGLKRRWETFNKNIKINKAVKKCPK